jgi:oligopeptide transport system substrate-binding protein
MPKFLRVVLCLAAFLLITIFAGCGKSGSNAPVNGEKAVTFNLRAEAKTIDPQLETDESTSKVLAMCMEGLVRLGKKAGEVVPGAAKKWTVSKNGLVWTFYLRKDAKWSNGKSVTANDFMFAIKRALTPSTAAQYAYIFYYMKNAEDYNTGKIKDFSKVGLKVINDYEIQFTLNNPVTYFAQILAMAPAYPVNEQFYNSVKDQFALNAKDLLYNGPYELTSWIPNGKYKFVKNPYYWNKKNIKIDKINFLMVDNYNTAANMFRSGGLDMTMITGDQIPQFKNSKDMHQLPSGGIWYLQFNVKNKFFKNLKIRKAVAMAINRDVFCKNIAKDGSLPARAFVPPGIAGAKGNTFRDEYAKSYFKDNVKEAQKLYKKGLAELNYKGKVHVTLLVGQSDKDRKYAQYFQQQLFENLGMNVSIESNTFQGRLVKMHQGDYDMVYAGWSPDYNDPLTFMNLWITGGGNNDTGWSNAQYDKDINIAETNGNNSIRMKAMANAEKILMSQMPVVPITFDYRTWLIRPWLKGYVIRNAGTEISFYWAYIANSK